MADGGRGALGPAAAPPVGAEWRHEGVCAHVPYLSLVVTRVMAPMKKLLPVRDRPRVPEVGV